MNIQIGIGNENQFVNQHVKIKGENITAPVQGVVGEKGNALNEPAESES